ncbi:MAG TPA: hypothetical protein DCZ72_12610 [Armatimonadetes bacterium]|nr:hypothetical protein [Armatimonadota bacterium]
MATVERFSLRMVQAALDANGWQYEVDDDGDYRVGFANEDIQVAVYPMVRGNDNDLLSLMATSPLYWSDTERNPLIEACNEWNAERRWPTAYLMADSDGDLRISLDWHVDLSPGVHHELLLDMINTFVATAMGFWEWMRDDKLLLGDD